ncbi:MAG: four helix bundle protein [Myxococcota bacterium]
MNDQELYFPHEKLDCYRLAEEVARWVADATFRRGDADLRDQAVRSARSVVLNIAEGSGKRGKSRRHSYDLALGEAGEACSAIGMARLDGGEVQQQKLRRVGMMLRAMIR